MLTLNNVSLVGREIFINLIYCNFNVLTSSLVLVLKKLTISFSVFFFFSSSFSFFPKQPLTWDLVYRRVEQC